MPPLHAQNGSHEINKRLLHIQVIKDYYHMTTMNESSTFIVIFFSKS